MTHKMADQGPSLFDWAAAQPISVVEPPRLPVEERAPVVDFLDRRETLPRFILCQPSPVAHIDRAIARKKGALAPAPIIVFPQKHPASPGSYSPEPSRRQG
ncbi:hypothetical protein GGC47_001065 [Bosea sp. OAE752]|uniref:hypothetical protein n=1 Tax=Bosea sp. OAE752 TaxID=2663873 RepID=UPI003D20F084